MITIDLTELFRQSTIALMFTLALAIIKLIKPIIKQQHNQLTVRCYIEYKPRHKKKGL